MLSSLAKTWIHRAGRAYTRRITQAEEAAQIYAANERSAVFQFAFRSLTVLRPVRIVDVGLGASAFPALLRECGYVVKALSVDDAFNRHSAVEDLGRLPSLSRCDAITCLLALQALLDPAAAVRQFFRALYPGGHLLLAAPYNETQPLDDVYALPEAGYRRRGAARGRVFSPAELSQWAAENHATLVEQEFWECFSGAYWQCGEHIRPPRSAPAEERRQLVCALYRKELDPEAEP